MTVKCTLGSHGPLTARSITIISFSCDRPCLAATVPVAVIEQPMVILDKLVLYFEVTFPIDRELIQAGFPH